MKAKGARIIDIKPTGSSTSKRFSVATIKNTGADARSWWWYHGLTSSQVSAKLKANRAVLFDIEREANGRYTVVMIRPKKSYKWWWYSNQSTTSLSQTVAQNGARIERITTWGSGSKRRFATIMVNNSNALTSRIGGILRGGTVKYGGSTSAYLKKVGGAVLASLNSTRSYEPASSLKALHLLRAAQDIDNNQLNLSDLIPWSNLSSRTDDPSTSVDEAKDGCPDGFAANSQISLQNAMSQMMLISDNRTTEAIRRLYGFAGLNGLAASIGLTSTKVNHRIGCGGPTRNQFSTKDAAKLYESVARGTSVGGEGQDSFWDAMINSQGGVRAIINDEIDKYIDDLELTGSAANQKRNQLIADFRSKVTRHTKGGSYTLCRPNSGSNCFPREIIRSSAGRIQIPMKIRTGRIITNSYVFGVFMDSVVASNTTQESRSRKCSTKCRKRVV